MDSLDNRPQLRRRGLQIGFWWESQEEGDLEDLDIGGRMILK
jgi:hypothetical protein